MAIPGAVGLLIFVVIVGIACMHGAWKEWKEKEFRQRRRALEACFFYGGSLK